MKQLFLMATPCLLIVTQAFAAAKKPEHDADELIRTAVAQLIDMQESDGAWPYEGVYRVAGDIPIGYRVGGTALVCEAILFAAPPDDKAAHHAVDAGLNLILESLDDPDMAASIQNTYDVRIWGQAYALEFLAFLSGAGRCSTRQPEVDNWLPKLVDALVKEELPGGGWNYAGRNRPASFVTAPIVQALLTAQGHGVKVPDDVLRRARDVLLDGRLDDGTFYYSGTRQTVSSPSARAQLPGSVARSAVCETTLLLLGAGSENAVAAAVEAFHKHWDELEKRRKQPGTHTPPYGIAPYYFYYGHRYAAQAVEMLPQADRPALRRRMIQTLMRTRDDDGTWNDRVFSRSRNYGTAMSVMVLLGDRMPRPAPWRPQPIPSAATSNGTSFPAP